MIKSSGKKIAPNRLNTSSGPCTPVIGRRRVGKTFLIKNEYKHQIVFEVTGLQNAPIEEQLENFTYRIKKAADSPLLLQTPTSWLKAFMLLIDYLETLDLTERKVVFLDELSWMSTHKSGFLRH